MFRRLRKRPATVWVIGLATGLLIGAGATAGVMNLLAPQEPAFRLPEQLLHATASHGENSLTLATGPIDEEVEGLYVLDHVTGELQCWVMNSRRPGTFSGMFKTTNVLRDLGVEADKAPKFVMVTGQYVLRSAAGTTRPANSIVYVADANSGNIAAYWVMWNRSAINSGAPQAGPMLGGPLGKGRTAAIRPGGVGDPGGQP